MAIGSTAPQGSILPSAGIGIGHVVSNNTNMGCIYSHFKNNTGMTQSVTLPWKGGTVNYNLTLEYWNGPVLSELIPGSELVTWGALNGGVVTFSALH